MRKKISVQELQTGMYVWELDRPWVGTPFTYQGFVVRSQKEVDSLKKLCREVYIDTEKAESAEAVAAVGAPLAGLPGTGQFVHREIVAVENEWPQARNTLHAAHDSLADVFDAVRVRKLLDVAIQSVLTGQKAPAEALEAAQDEADRLLKPYR